MPTSRYINLTAQDGHQFRAFLAAPDTGGPFPCLILLHEIFGINTYMRTMAREFADAGFLAIVPDLFARQELDVDLHHEGEDFDKALKLRDGLDVTMALTDISAAIVWARAAAAGNSAVGTLGYCLGGGLAFLAAVTQPVDCAVSYYAVGLQERVGLGRHLDVPLLLHFAENDHYCPPEARQAISTVLTGVPDVEMYLYQGAGHAFATYGRDTFRLQPTQVAWARTIDFLHKWLPTHEGPGDGSSTIPADTASC
ncbi:dienelactone hydrolase [Arthrobacter globiformis]|uniref:dienelactone hydrolase family protein n=1 Tax=Arthrobacter globiformis TaxID=1665 RepID=UPI0027848F45|nr:dienelactone hydrolase family protein [Arthrobacter globiformis]MDQ1060824.1 dienelactone hydrolase [Arthrobacter globiformis]